MISINIYEIAMQMVNFMVLLFLLNKFAIKPLSQFLETRAASIKEDIETAESNKVDSEKLLEEQKELFQKAREEAKEIRLNVEQSSKVEREQIITDSAPAPPSSSYPPAARSASETSTVNGCPRERFGMRFSWLAIPCFWLAPSRTSSASAIRPFHEVR